MKTASVAELKARLSEFLATVRAGDDVVITDRGRPVARLTALRPGGSEARVAELVRTGAVRPPLRAASQHRRLPAAAPEDADGRLLRVLLQERAEGR